MNQTPPSSRNRLTPQAVKLMKNNFIGVLDEDEPTLWPTADIYPLTPGNYYFLQTPKHYLSDQPNPFEA